MSYSTCLVCEKLVSGYQKYCTEHEKQHMQDESFWLTTKKVFFKNGKRDVDAIIKEKESDRLWGEDPETYTPEKKMSRAERRRAERESKK